MARLGTNTMLRLGRMTDYAVVVMGHMTQRHGQLQTTSDVVISTGLPVPTVSKLLHRLADLGLLTAIRGRNGGYRMDRGTAEISVAEIIAGFEGPIALTDCLPGSGAMCEHENHCQVGGRWVAVANAVHQVLDDMSLADMLGVSAPRAMGDPFKNRQSIPGVRTH